MPPIVCFFRAAARVGLVAATVWLAACRSTPPPPPEPPPDAPKKPAGLFEWNGEGKGISHIQINVDEQKAYLFQGKEQVGWSYVATGITSFPTPTGDFKILEKVQDKVSNLYGKSYTPEGKLANSDFKVGLDLGPGGGHFEPAKMPYFMRLTGDGVGMHIGPIPRPGRRASHGCIRLPSKMAPIIYKNIGIGTPVTIVGSGPDYQTYLKQSAAKAKANAAKLAAAKKKAAEAEAEAAAVTSLPPGDPNGPPSPVPAGTPGTATIAPPPDMPLPPTEPILPAPPGGQN